MPLKFAAVADASISGHHFIDACLRFGDEGSSLALGHVRLAQDTKFVNTGQLTKLHNDFSINDNGV